MASRDKGWQPRRSAGRRPWEPGGYDRSRETPFVRQARGQYNRNRNFARAYGPGWPDPDFRPAGSGQYDRDFTFSQAYGSEFDEPGGQAGFWGAYDPALSGYEEGLGAEWHNQGPFTGIGPRGYQPSDDRLRETACERLARHGQIDASDISVDISNGEITLNGTVDSRRTKRLAEDAVLFIPGVIDVHNRLRIRR